jgi:enamine deaminase RidA (YjgF/YER057c/UK114 family)
MVWENTAMSEVTHLNPDTLSKPTGYTHVVSARGQRLIYVAGQIAFDKNGELVGRGDLRAQAVQVYENVKSALEAANATLDDVVKLNTYVVNYTPELRPILAGVRSQYFAQDRPPANTLVGVTSLALEGLLLEIEAVAVSD